MFGKAGLGGLMKQAQQMQEKHEKGHKPSWLKPKLKVKQAMGLVKVVMTCSHVVRKLEISPDLIQEAADDKEMLEDLVLAAINAASEKPKKPPTKPWVHSPKACLPVWAISSVDLKINKRPSEARFGFQTAFFIMRTHGLSLGKNKRSLLM